MELRRRDGAHSGFGTVSFLCQARDRRLAVHSGHQCFGAWASQPIAELNAVKEPLDVIVSAAMISAVPSVWMYVLVTESLAWPTRAALVTSVKPRSLAMLTKL